MSKVIGAVSYVSVRGDHFGLTAGGQFICDLMMICPDDSCYRLICI